MLKSIASVLGRFTWTIIFGIFVVSCVIIVLAMYATCVHPDFCIKPKNNAIQPTVLTTAQRQLSDPSPEAQCWFQFEGVCVPNVNPCPFKQSSNLKPFNCSDEHRCCKPQPPVVGSLPARKSCGMAPAPPERFRINNAWITVAWPWIVSIRRDNKHICGGTIVSPSVVLSAAHCFVKPPEPSNYSVVTGEYDIAKDDGTEKIFTISQIISKDYNYSSGWNDVVILTLNGKIEMDFHRQPACLPVSEDKFRFLKSTRSSDTDVCFVIGWGRSMTRPDVSELQMAALPLIDPQRCKTMLSKLKWLIHVFDDRYNICTYFDSDYMITDTCPGDSGGPLFCKRKGKIILAGIVSWGAPPCASPDHPGVYAKVLHYIPWIQKIVKDLPK